MILHVENLDGKTVSKFTLSDLIKQRDDLRTALENLAEQVRGHGFNLDEADSIIIKARMPFEEAGREKVRGQTS